jgi:DNA-directed RNA polymerase subunit RPC12/RpoP
MGKTCGNCRHGATCVGCDDWEPSSAPGPGSGDALAARIDSAIKRITSGAGPMRIPADDTDPDIVLYDCKAALAALRSERDDWAEAAQHICDLFDPAKPMASPAVLRAVTNGVKRANSDLRAERDALRARVVEAEAHATRAENAAHAETARADAAEKALGEAKNAATELQGQFDRAIAQRDALARDLRAAREALMLANPENVECDSDFCAECGELYELRDGCDPTPECDRCAHALLAKVRAAARAVVGEGKNDG